MIITFVLLVTRTVLLDIFFPCFVMINRPENKKHVGVSKCNLITFFRERNSGVDIISFFF